MNEPFDEFLGDSAPSDVTPSSLGDGSSVVDTPAVETATSTATPDTTTDVAIATTPTTLSPDTSALIARERLPAVPGETESAALRRLYDHQRQRADRLYYDEVRGAKTAAQQAREELASFKTAMDPLVRAFHERQAEAQKELELAQVPEKGTADYLVWQQQQIINRMEQREQREAEERVEAEELAHQETLITMDEAADYHLEQALNTDPEVKAAYEFAVQLGIRAASRAYPTATSEQLQEVVRLSHIIDMRNALNNGVAPGDLFKQRMADVLTLTGGGNRQPAPAPAAVAATNGKAKPGSPTAQQLSTAKAQAKARAAVSPTPAAANPPSGDGTDFSQMDEESLTEFVLASSANAAEYSRWIDQKFGKTSWR